MKKNIFLSIIILLTIYLPVNADENNCLVCHRDFEDETEGPSYLFTKDIHYQKGLGCVDCHGGDASLDDMDDVRRVKDYRGVPSHLEVPGFCSRCHSNADYMKQHNPALPIDQLDKYKTSEHGHRLFNKKDRKVANCISCHSVHDIGEANMPHSTIYPLNIPRTCGKCHADADYMKGYKIPTSQVDDYTQSVHGIALLEKQDLGAPACNDCHGNHGAAPPGFSSLAVVCGLCHVEEANLFNHSPHKPAFEEYEYPMCETCHSNHKILKPHDSMVGIEEPAVCIECHDKDDGNFGYATAEKISSAINILVTAHDEAAELLNEAVNKDMMTTDEEFLIKEVEQTLNQSRRLVHSFNADSVTQKTEEGLTKAQTVKANSASLIDEYYFRRKGLAVATVFILIMAAALYLWIRRLD